MVRALTPFLALIGWLILGSPAMAGPDAKLMILHDHGSPVVSEMVKLRVRGEYDLTVSLADMEFPDSPDYDWIQIGRDDWHKERVNGRLLQIFERQIAVFPQHDGPITIGPLTHDVTYVPDTGGRAKLAITAPVTTLNVKPFPGNHRPLAAKQLTLTDELSAQPGQLKSNEILTRRVTIEAIGTLAHYLPPRPDLTQPWMVSFTAPEVRETIMTPKGPEARVVWEWQMRPHTGEPGILPGSGFAWFDTDDRHIQIAPMQPIPFGFVGFGSNFGDAEEPASLMVLAAGGAVMAGVLAGLALLLWRRGFVSMELLRARLRRMLPSPHIKTMRHAAKAGDLNGLRAAAAAHLNWRGVSSTKTMAALDRQLFAENPAKDFDADAWLREFRAELSARGVNPIKPQTTIRSSGS